MTDTIIFDMDGTLLNTLEDLTDSTNYALSQFGLPGYQVSDIRNFVGNGADQLIERAIAGRLTKREEQKCLEIFKQYYSENMNNKTRPYDGVIDLVKQLLEMQYRIAIVSNKYDSAVKELNEIYFENLFPVAIGASERVAKKPAPDSVYEALKQLESQKDHAIYIGDSDVDALTAQNAGMTFVGVSWGFHDKDLLLAMGAVQVIEKPEELLGILTRRNVEC